MSQRAAVANKVELNERIVINSDRIAPPCNPFEYHIPTKIFYGVGEFSKIRERKLPGNKALIVITAGKSLIKHGYLKKLTEQLEEMKIQYVIYDKVQANPTKDHVMEARDLLMEEKCDFIIGFGGGSSIDSAKAISVVATNKGDLWDYYTAGSGKGISFKTNPMPMVAVPTTAGTGTEANPFMVITNTETNEKMGFGNENTFPCISIIDPLLTLSIPKRLTALQGFDTLFHSVEGYLNKKASTASDLFALESVRLIGKSLAQAVNQGDDVSARADVSLASTLAGFVQTISDCTSHHSIEHAMSGFHPELEHGAGLILISKAYFSHFASNKKCRERFITLAKALGMKEANDPMDFIKGLEKLMVQCGVGKIHMEDYNIEKEEFERIADTAQIVGGRMFLGDPVPLLKEDIIAILHRSYDR